MLSAKSVAMSTLKGNAAAANGSGRGIGKSRKSRRHGNARTAFQSLVTATSPYHNWPDFAYEVSSGSSEQDDGKRSSLGRTSNNEDFRLACPYSKLKSLEVIQSMREAVDMDRSRCWGKSYRNISRLKYAEMLPEFTLSMIANETFQNLNRQHLYRVHCRPEFICRRCQQEFPTEELLDSHSSRMPICDPRRSHVY